MNTAAKGRSREHSVKRTLEAFGFCVFRAPGSKGIDLFAIHERDEWPHLAIEVGGEDKRIRASFEALRSLRKPIGTLPMVVRCVRQRWRWHANEDEWFKTLDAALERAVEVSA